MKIINLPNGSEVIVDEKSFDELSKYKWYYNLGYAVRRATKEEKENGSPNFIRMHRQLLNAPEGILVDHINRNRLDNRLENLRLCDKSKNAMNSEKILETIKGKSSSIYKGVYWAKDRNKWRATIKVSGKNIHIGSFDNEIEAAKAYNDYAIKHFGEFAFLNEIAQQNVKRIVNEGSTKKQALFYVKNKEDLYMSKKDEVQTDPTVLNPETKFGGGGGSDDSQK